MPSHGEGLGGGLKRALGGNGDRGNTFNNKDVVLNVVFKCHDNGAPFEDTYTRDQILRGSTLSQFTLTTLTPFRGKKLLQP